MPQDFRSQRLMDATHHLSDASPPWDEVLSGACEMLGGDSATLIMLGGDGELLLAQQHGASAAAERDYVEHFFAQDMMSSHAAGKPAGTWLDSSELFTAAQLGRSGYYVDFMRKHGMRQMTALMLGRPEVCRCGLTIQYGKARSDRRSELEGELVTQFSHQLQAALLGRQAQADVLFDTMASTFSALTEALLLGTAAGTVRKISSKANSLLSAQDELRIVTGRLRHADPDTDARIADAWRRAASGGAPVRIRLPKSTGGHALTLDFVRADPRLGVSQQEASICVRVCLANMQIPSAEQLARAFPITAAEARVLLALVQGETIKRHAQQRGVSNHTVRKQVATLMEKLGCSRQMDLVRRALAIL